MRLNRTYTLTAGSPINISNGSTVAPSALDTTPVYATRIFIQMLHGGSGLGYVMDGIKVGQVPAASADGQLTAELAAASLTAPGGSYSDYDYTPGGGIDIRKMWIDGSHTADTVVVSIDFKN